MQIQHPFSNKQTPIETLKHLMTTILLTHTAYDCMPLNSSINSIDKSTSLYDAINILINQQIEQLLVWDEDKSRWVWMLTLVDTIRFITHALKSLLRRGFVDFSDFQKEKKQMDGAMISNISECSKQQLEMMITKLKEKSISDIIGEITDNSPVKEYIRLKSVPKQAKLSHIILTMIVEQIHRILVQDTETDIFVSVLNFKDVFLYLLRIANQSPMTYYNSIDISSLLQARGSKNTVIQIEETRPLWQAFEIMTDRQKSLWINVVDSERRFKGLIFRQDFRGIFQGWHVDYLWMSVGDFVHLKKQNETGNVPQYREFQPQQITKDIIWKMVMTKRNTIVWINQENRVQYTIGLMQLFKLYAP